MTGSVTVVGRVLLHPALDNDNASKSSISKPSGFELCIA